MSNDEKPAIDPLILPMIEKTEYPEFQRLVPGLPDTYALWLDLHKAEKNAWEKRWEFRQDAHVVQVSIAKFRKHLAETGKAATVPETSKVATVEELRRCAEMIAKAP
jgi:hypothetical protein